MQREKDQIVLPVWHEKHWGIGPFVRWFIISDENTFIAFTSSAPFIIKRIFAKETKQTHFCICTAHNRVTLLLFSKNAFLMTFCECSKSPN